MKQFFCKINSIDYYLSRSELKTILIYYDPLFRKIKRNIFYRILYFKFYLYYKNIYNNINIKNDKYVDNLIETNSDILDNINGYALDYEQKKSVLTDEDNVLVVAGAGSGKSLTIIGKIRYLIEEKNINEKDILCISFTRDSANSLKNSIKKNYNYNINVLTFHKLGLDILSYTEENLQIVSDDYLDFIIDEIFKSTPSANKIINDKHFYYYLKKTIITFLKLFKSNGYTIEKFNNFFIENSKEKNKIIRNRNNIILSLIKEIYIIYENELLSSNKIDFDDMILKSAISISKNGINRNYKYIIIDEYQDTSFIRYKLIYEIKKCTDAKIMAVGDDFQSIYRFTGCNLDIFLKFEEYYGYSKILKIQNTYRNSQELIDVAGSFIMKNKNQIKKDLKSSKRINKPIKIFYYKDEKEDFKKLINLVYEKNKTPIYILGRNNNDIKNVIDETCVYNNGVIQLKDNQKVQIKYFTVHKSKGLEEENVIIINLSDNKMGFPSKISNDKIISYVLNTNDCYLYEEERRLFYVALTRTKSNVYLFVKNGNESIFVREIINNQKNNIEIINKVL